MTRYERIAGVWAASRSQSPVGRLLGAVYVLRGSVVVRTCYGPGAYRRARAHARRAWLEEMAEVLRRLRSL